jgi:hypothetical protein
MNSAVLPRSALLGKTNAFFAPRLVVMQSIPNGRAEKTKDVADHRSEHGQHSRSQCIE